MSNLAGNAQMVSINAIYILLAASALKILAQKHIQKIPYAKLVTPSKNETEITEPVPVRIENATFLPEPRIIGGEPADIKDFPFMVNVLKEGKHFCGGSYIKPTWVLTAAHCLIHPRIILPLPTKLFTVKMGATLLEGDEFEQERRAVSVISHADFHYYNNSCDIGLIEIDKPFDLNERIKFVEIPVKFNIYEDENCTVLGWGVLREEDVNYERYSNRLQKVTVPVVDESVCKQIYSTPKYSKLFQDHKTICAGYLGGGRDACQGDSGGPLLLNGIQIGVVSWGIGCGNEIPGVYTNTYYYRDWIDELVARTPYIVHRRQDSKSERSRSTISIPVMDEPILSDAAGMLIGINVITLLMLILVIFTFESEVKICNIMLTNKNNHAFNVIFHP